MRRFSLVTATNISASSLANCPEPRQIGLELPAPRECFPLRFTTSSAPFDMTQSA